MFYQRLDSRHTFRPLARGPSVPKHPIINCIIPPGPRWPPPPPPPSFLTPPLQYTDHLLSFWFNPPVVAFAPKAKKLCFLFFLLSPLLLLRSPCAVHHQMFSHRFRRTTRRSSERDVPEHMLAFSAEDNPASLPLPVLIIPVEARPLTMGDYALPAQATEPSTSPLSPTMVENLPQRPSFAERTGRSFDWTRNLTRAHLPFHGSSALARASSLPPFQGRMSLSETADRVSCDTLGWSTESSSSTRLIGIHPIRTSFFSTSGGGRKPSWGQAMDSDGDGSIYLPSTPCPTSSDEDAQVELIRRGPRHSRLHRRPHVRDQNILDWLEGAECHVRPAGIPVPAVPSTTTAVDPSWSPTFSPGSTSSADPNSWIESSLPPTIPESRPSVALSDDAPGTNILLPDDTRHQLKARPSLSSRLSSRARSGLKHLW